MVKTIVTLLRRGHVNAIWQRVKQRVDSEYVAYGLRRDLIHPFEAPAAKIAIQVRRLETRDLASLLNIEPGIDGLEASLKLYQSRIVKADLAACYVAVDANDEACFMQWLIGPAYNDKIQEHFQGIFPVLAPDEALMEAAYTPANHRGKGIMPSAMARIAEKGRDLGVQWAITFVGVTNIPSLKGCNRAGFRPYLLRTDRWHWFRHQIVFEPLPKDAAYPWETGLPPQPAAVQPA